MNVVKTITNGRPVTHRALVRRAHFHHAARPPSGKNLKFPELFAARPTRPGASNNA
jgi:hypothetical protein